VKPDSHLFRREAARLTATLTRAFGIENLALAEDVVQETLANAFEVWSYQGVPEHYAALLTAAAKNRALDVFRRERTARKFAPEVRRFMDLRSSIDRRLAMRRPSITWRQGSQHTTPPPGALRRRTGGRSSLCTTC